MYSHHLYLYLYVRVIKKKEQKKFITGNKFNLLNHKTNELFARNLVD